MKSIARLLMLIMTTGAAGTARAEVKVADDVWNGAGRFSRLDYGISERFKRAWLTLHFTSRAPCLDRDGECDFDEAVRVSVPGITYDPAARQVLYTEDGGAPVLCASVVQHTFIFSWETVDETGNCAYRIVDINSFVDDGYEGRQDNRKEIHFGVRPFIAR